MCCPRTSQVVPYLPSFSVLLPFPSASHIPLPHVLSEGRWIALFCDINNMSYCWRLRGKAVSSAFLLTDWMPGMLDAFPCFLFISFHPSNSFRPWSLSYSLVCLLYSCFLFFYSSSLLPLGYIDRTEEETHFAFIFLAQKWLLWEDQGICRSLIRDGLINKLGQFNRVWGIVAAIKLPAVSFILNFVVRFLSLLRLCLMTCYWHTYEALLGIKTENTNYFSKSRMLRW